MHTLSWKIATRSAIKQCRRFAIASLRRCSDALHSSTHRHRPCHSMFTSPYMKSSSTRHLLRQYFTEGGSPKWHHKQCYQYDVSRLSFGTHSGQSRSPYVVLQVSANASKSEIKAAFRKVGNTKLMLPFQCQHNMIGLRYECTNVISIQSTTIFLDTSYLSACETTSSRPENASK